MTTEGEMQFEMWDDVAPKHVESILTLAKQDFSVVKKSISSFPS